MWPERERATQPEAKLADERRMAAWIGKSVIVKGDVVCSEDLTIDGQVEGTIEVGAHNLTIGVSAIVHAELVARTIVISGTVTGNVTATERIDLRATGSIEGDVQTPRFAMAEGATMSGHVDTGMGGKR
jgi:cytoskeletal protein CcmA (bactofilin family)